MTKASSVMSSEAVEAAPATENLRSCPDEELLNRFLRERGPDAEAAFEALLYRHGPMVLGVCRQILVNAFDAEDAFQATFLALATNAGSIRDRRVLANWLYEVAYHIAIRAKFQSTRRRTHERHGAQMPFVATEHGGDPAWDELRPVLHDEVNRLPEKYRRPVVLCYFEGLTNEEAAGLLDWPVGTVKGRLSRARDLLRSRLTRRGLALSAAFLVARLSNSTVFAEVVPSRLADATVRTAMLGARGGSCGLAAVDPRVADLATYSLQVGTAGTWLTRKLATMGLISVAAAAVTVGLYLLLLQDIHPLFGGTPATGDPGAADVGASCQAAASVSP